MRCPSGGTARPIGACAVVSGTSMTVRSSTSDLPGLEVDARVDEGISEVGNQGHHEPDQRQDIEVREYHRIVAVEHAFEAEEAHSVEREDGLDQERTGEECRYEGVRKSGDDDKHRVAEHVPIEYPALVVSLGAGGEDVLLADLVQKGVLGQQRQGGERA